MRKSLLLITALFALSLGANAQEKQVYSSYNEMVAAAKKEVQLISVFEYHNLYTNALSTGDIEYVLIDVRTEAEYNEGFIPGAFLVQRGTLELRLENDEVWKAFNHAKPQKSDVIILYCGGGGRSALAAKSLNELGYKNVKSLEGGWSNWSEKFPKLKKMN